MAGWGSCTHPVTIPASPTEQSRCTCPIPPPLPPPLVLVVPPPLVLVVPPPPVPGVPLPLPPLVAPRTS
jgi:hypothetical protein